jgi:hypothetical protein
MLILSEYYAKVSTHQLLEIISGLWQHVLPHLHCGSVLEIVVVKRPFLIWLVMEVFDDAFVV